MTRREDIEHLLRAGDRIRARVLDVRLLKSPRGYVRVAIVVPKHGHNSVSRNRLKRRLRELTRVDVLPRPGSFDVLLRARRESYGATFDALREDVRRAVPGFADPPTP